MAASILSRSGAVWATVAMPGGIAEDGHDHGLDRGDAAVDEHGPAGITVDRRRGVVQKDGCAHDGAEVTGDGQGKRPQRAAPAFPHPVAAAAEGLGDGAGEQRDSRARQARQRPRCARAGETNDRDVGALHRREIRDTGVKVGATDLSFRTVAEEVRTRQHQISDAVLAGREIRGDQGALAVGATAGDTHCKRAHGQTVAWGT